MVLLDYSGGDVPCIDSAGEAWTDICLLIYGEVRVASTEVLDAIACSTAGVGIGHAQVAVSLESPSLVRMVVMVVMRT